MGIFLWIIVGLIGGYAGRKIVGDDGGSLIANLVVGVVGALIGGFLINLIGGEGINGFNPYSILVAIGGSVLLLWVMKKLT